MLPKVDESFKKAFLAWENQAAEQWTGLLRNPDFLKNMWQSVEMSLAQQRTMSQMVQKNLDAMDMPTKGRQARIDEQIEQLQRMVAELDGQVDELLKVVAKR